MPKSSAQGIDMADTLPPLIMGGAGFSYQLHTDPHALPALDIVKSAFRQGLRVIDTSPYYEPSEEILGKVLSHPDIAKSYKRKDFKIMTKCGRISAEHFDYSPSWIRKSVERSLHRFNTSYLDVVFCHDVDFVSIEAAVLAVGTLFRLADTGIVKRVGISGYDLGVLIRVAEQAFATYKRPVDVVQNWAQLCLQNTMLEQRGIPALKAVGVRAICNASPLACGLLRSGGVPVGKLGDWHPAPAGLREASQRASDWMAEEGDSLASVALCYAIVKSLRNTSSEFTVSTITGIGSMEDLQQNISTATSVLGRGASPEAAETAVRLPLSSVGLNEVAMPKYERLFIGVQQILGEWLDYDLSSRDHKPEPTLSEKETGKINAPTVGARI